VLAVTLADGKRDGVGSASEVGVGGEVKLEVVLSGGISVEELFSALINVGSIKVNAYDTRASSVDDGVQGLDGELLSNRARGGRDREGGNVDSSVKDLGAGVELLAVPDGVGISVVNDLDEFLDANEVAEEVTSNIEDLAGEEVAELSTSTNNATI